MYQFINNVVNNFHLSYTVAFVDIYTLHCTHSTYYKQICTLLVRERDAFLQYLSLHIFGNCVRLRVNYTNIMYFVKNKFFGVPLKTNNSARTIMFPLFLSLSGFSSRFLCSCSLSLSLSHLTMAKLFAAHLLVFSR